MTPIKPRFPTALRARDFAAKLMLRLWSTLCLLLAFVKPEQMSTRIRALSWPRIDWRQMMQSARETAWIYRFDLLAVAVLCGAVFAFLAPMWKPGFIVFSDLDFGLNSKRYLGEIYGVWNERWSTPTMLNIARLPWIVGPWLISGLFGWSGAVFLKSFITMLLLASAGSMYWLCKRITSVYFSRHFDFITTFGLLGGALYYALNPWVVFRIQHVFLLCGYSLMPGCLLFFFNAFDPRFQRQFIAGYQPSRVKLYRRHIFDLFCFALTFSVSAGAIHYFFYGVIFYSGIGFLLLLHTLHGERGGWRARWGVVKVTLLKLVIAGALFSCFSAFWLGAYVGSIIKHAQVSQHNVNVVDTLSLFSRNSDPLYVLYLMSYWWPMFDLHTLPKSFWLGGGALLGLVLFAIILRGWKHRILMGFSVLSVLFAVMGTGVQVGAFAPMFVKLVTKTPVIGPIFRDPNKAVGLMAVGFSILLTVGTQILVRWMESGRHKRWTQPLAIGGVLVALWCYVAPVRHQFVEGFYKPIPLPAEYTRVQGETIDPDRFDSRMLYLPIADAMTQSTTGISTPSWNQNPIPGGMVKATGDFQVYSSRKNALFHHEGNSPNVGYYLDFVQGLLDRGATMRAGRLLGPLGINELAYHKEYLGQEKRQGFNLDILGLQSDLPLRKRDGIFSLYSVAPLPYLSVVPRRVFTPYGLTSLESYGSFPGFNFRDNGVVFSGWEKNGGLAIAQKGDLFDMRSLDDLALATLDREDYLVPFDGVEDGDPFLKWSKTLLANPDWQWSLRTQNLRGFSYETDLNASVVLTFASRRLDVPPYKIVSVAKDAPVVVNFDQMLQNGKMFVADAPDKVTVQSFPTAQFNRLPLVQGQISRAEPRNVWQVAKSGVFPANPDTPYQFRVLASGRGTNRLHMKVRFFDAQKQEIGAQYVVTPGEKVDFDAINLYGECISPPGTRSMRLDLLTLPRKEQKVFWWIHDVEIRSLAKWAVPNVIRQTRKLKVATQVEIFARVLMNARGGGLKFGFGPFKRDLSTRDTSQTQFVWKHLGQFSLPKGDVPVTIESRGGFNAINILAIVPVANLQAARQRVRARVKAGRFFCPLQAETDFNIRGPIQSERNYPLLSLGRGFAANTGRLSRPIEILKSAPYCAALWLSTGQGSGEIALFLTDERGRVVRRTWKAPRADERQQNWVVEPDPDLDFPRKLKRLPGVLTGFRRVEMPLGRLNPGRYTLSIDINSRVASLTTLASMRLFNPKEIRIDNAGIAEKDSSCAACVSITNDMMHSKFDNGTFRAEMQPTCSCEWFINASNMFAADEQSEYLVSFDARSQGVRARHTKVFCLDAQKRPLDTVFINEVEASEQKHWNAYQQIVLTPPGTRFLQFQVWARGGEGRTWKDPVGTVEVRRFSLLPMKRFISLDQVAIVEGARADDLFSPLPVESPIGFGRVDSMKRWFNIESDKPQLIRYAESPSPLWELSLNGHSGRSDVALNGVSNGFVVQGGGRGTIQAVLRGIYGVGVMLMGVGFVLGALLWKFAAAHQSPREENTS